MKLNIPKNIFNNPTPPRTFLCTPGKKIMGEIHAYDRNLNAKWNSYSDFSFSVDRVYTDIIDGVTKVNTLFDKIEGLRLVLIEDIGYFIIQDPDTIYSDKDSKTLSCFSLEYGTGSKYLENFYINTGAEDAKEVIYEQSKYGYNATRDQMYKPAKPDGYDPEEDYFHRVYTDARNYTYEQIQITNEEAYKSYFGDDVPVDKVLYVHGYANIRFYDPHTPELSLLHLVFEAIPEWTIGHVDYSLYHKERKFEEDRIAVYDFLMNEVHDTFKCVIEWDTLTGRVNFYEEADDGITEDNTVQTRFDTDVYISRDNLASEIQIQYSTDNIKTKLKVSGADDLDIREVNLGKNYLINLDYYHNEDWMDKELVEAYDNYLKAVKENTPKYTEATQNWVAAYDKWNDLMNAVPADGNVVLVGDLFKKLYCVYGLYNSVKEFTEGTTYYVMYEDGSMGEANPQPNAENFAQRIYYIKGDDEAYKAKEKELIIKLTQHYVNEDIEANKNDNILLRLKNSDNDVATIRVYNSNTQDSPEYKIQVLVVRASTGMPEAAKVYELSSWINGNLRVGNKDNPGALAFLDGFKINYIGIMGAYFVLAKDERKLEVLEEYGVNLLREKHKTYVSIFTTQTEAMYSQEDYQCIAQNDEPSTEYDVHTKWFDTNNSQAKLYELLEVQEDGQTIKKWVDITKEVYKSEEVSAEDQKNYNNYQRYIDNYEKMVAVQEVLVKKEKEAEYCLNGFAVGEMSIDANNITSNVSFYIAADKHFRTDNDEDGSVIITNGTLSKDIIPLYTFTTPKAQGEFAVYLNGTTPYVAYVDSQGVYQAIRNALAEATNFESFFTREQWIALSPLIREDEYSDSNFLLTGYESEEERLRICNELNEAASKELKTLSQPSLEFSMTMGNILALPEFEPIKSQFALGNFIRIELRPGIVKRSRLLEVGLNLDDLSDFNTTFGNLVTTKSEIDIHADLLKQAVQAGKQVAAAAGDWQSAVDKSNKLEEAIASGLQGASLQVGRASGQAISWDDKGLFCRKFVDGSTDTYLDEQIAIINNKIVFTNDGWKTSKAALGEFELDINGDGVNEKMYGLLADAVVSGYVKGSVIEGGSLRIGGDKAGDGVFIVNEDGSVEIKVLTEDNGKLVGIDKYASQSAVEIIDNAYRFRLALSYDGSTIFSDTNQTCTITCNIYDYDTLITDKVIAANGTFSWIRSSSESDEQWNASHIKQGADANKIILTTTDVVKNSNFTCSVDFDETKITT